MLRKRIEDWLSSANCNCTGEDKVYCTYCDILFDVLDYMDSQGDNVDREEVNHDEVAAAAPVVAGERLGEPQKEAGAGEDS